MRERSPFPCGPAPAALCLTALLWLAGCAGAPTAPPSAPPVEAPVTPPPYQVFGKWYQPLPSADRFTESGIASWYGKKFHGRPTSSGEPYNMYAISAAHKTLPLGTWVRVRRLDSGRHIVVRVNDRGPFVHGRIIDLSYAGAKELDMVGPGTARVEIVALGERRSTASGEAFVPVDYYSGAFTFQVGAFSNRDNAERLRAKLDKTFTNAHVTPYDRGDLIFYRVRVGRVTDLAAAESYERHLAASGYPDAFIVAE